METYEGPREWSEPESRAIAEFVMSIKDSLVVSQSLFFAELDIPVVSLMTIMIVRVVIMIIMVMIVTVVFMIIMVTIVIIVVMIVMIILMIVIIVLMIVMIVVIIVIMTIMRNFLEKKMSSLLLLLSFNIIVVW